MSPRTARRWLFLAILLTVPAPMWVVFDGLIPPARFWILLGAAGAVALREGAAGPVPGLLALFAAQALCYSLLSWCAAWLLARLLGSLSPAARRNWVLAGVALLLVLALSFPLYRTPLGRAPVANLLGALS